MNILVVNYDNSGDDVMIFTETMTVEHVESRLKEKGEVFEEVYEVRDDEVQYYSYEPLWI
jgi:hypothetical protein